MSYKRKTWREKLADDKGFPKIFRVDESKRKSWGEGTFVIPAPSEVDGIMRRVPRGKLLTIDELRKILAKRHGTTTACPITTGIFAWIAAHAAVEAEAEGETKTTPYWRTLKTRGELNPKYPGGMSALSSRLVEEGHRVVAKGKRCFVESFEQKLARIE